MISEFFLNVIFTIVSGLLSILPDMSWTIDSTAFEAFLDIIRAVGYMLPMNTVSAIAGVVISLTVFRFVISIVRTIWDLLPLV